MACILSSYQGIHVYSIPSWKVFESSHYTLNANMADYLVGARDEQHKSKASWAFVVNFYGASPGKSYLGNHELLSFICFPLRGKWEN